MKQREAPKVKEILNNFYQNSKTMVWVYDRDMQLEFTNFTNAVLLHLMDAIEPIARAYKEEASYLDYMRLYGSSMEAYLCFQFATDRKHLYTVVVGPGLLTYPNEEIWKEFRFYKHVWSNKREETMNLIPVITLENFLLNARFIMQTFGLYHLNPLQLADSLPLNNSYYEETAGYADAAGRFRTDFYSVQQAYETERELSYHIQKGNEGSVDEIMTQKDRVDLLLPAQSGREILMYSIALLTIGRNAAISGGMRPETAYALFQSYSIRLQSCRQMLEFYRLTHDALCAFAEGVQTVSVQMLDSYSETIKSCIRLIHDHLPGKVTVDKLADEIHLTPKYLSALFRKETGVSLTDFIGKLRIDHACHMLKTTDMTYLEISMMLDFCSQSHFTASFKKAVGMTPKEYRMKNQRITARSD
ncbi:MAG: AraC family transcriptional regulator [Lachnospiraceae bacterium]|nr:AraC family transcriptional regulator [Lachnospiraceae bacterium]